MSSMKGIGKPKGSRGTVKGLWRFFACACVLALLVVSGPGCASTVEPASADSGSVCTTESEFRSYVQPESRSVKQALQNILGEPPYEISQGGFDAIRNWVADRIDYVSDSKKWGVYDRWQTAEETLSLGTGDCEDFAILLCSLLRAYGIDAEHVYVALGVWHDSEEPEHAFLIEDWDCDGEWRRIEPQARAPGSSSGSLISSLVPHPDSRLDKYEITAVFNDVYYYGEPASWNERQADALDMTVTKVLSVVSYLARGLWQALVYVLRLLLN